LKPFELFSFLKDQYASEGDKKKMVEKNDLYVNYAGSPRLKTLEIKQKAPDNASSGRRIRSKSASTAASKLKLKK
jgi:hypothetical protein